MISGGMDKEHWSEMGLVGAQLSIHFLCFKQFVTIVQFKKHENHQWRNVNFNEVLKVTLAHGCFTLY